MTAPAAPLEKAVANAREALTYHATCPGGGKWRECSSSLASALSALLASLDADRGEADAALREVADSDAPCWFTDDCPDTDEPCGTCGLKRVARRYFARREEKEVPRG